jgi:tRNA(Ile)-lysidine synthase
LTLLATHDAAAPLTDDDFARRMAALGPFERRPVVAVGVSGGADSLALTLLADRWARAQGGAVVALTVDHGLRADSAAEAATVRGWLTARGIRHHVLAWTGDKPAAGIPAAARAARYALLLGHCRAERILHLLLAHHGDDQAETLVLRRGARSGPDGLAGMAAVVETADVRLLRPLLDLPRMRLAATLSAIGQPWVEDPSNRDVRFTRARIRASLARAGAPPSSAAEHGVERAGRDADVAALLAHATVLHPEGWLTLDPGAIAAAPRDVGVRALARALLCVSGRSYPPRGERLERLYVAVCAAALGRGRTLSGCRIVPYRGRLLVLRELADVGPEIAVGAAGTYDWDDRFRVRVAGGFPASEVRLGPLGSSGWAAVAAVDKSLRSLPIPPAIRPTLPALRDLDGVREVPHLLYRRQGADPDSVRAVSAVFRPRHLLAGAGFAVSSPSRR